MKPSLDELRQELADYFKQHIPLGASGNVNLHAIDDTSLTLAAPLTSNHNDHDAAFGGSLYNLAVLAGWVVLFLECRKHMDNPHIVVRDAQMRYRHPVTDNEIKAICKMPNARQWEGFFAHYEKTGKTTLSLATTIYSDVLSSDNKNHEPAARLEAVYVLLES